jgi:hypothetical protein
MYHATSLIHQNVVGRKPFSMQVILIADAKVGSFGHLDDFSFECVSSGGIFSGIGT